MRYGKHVGVCALIGALVGGTPSCESDGSSSRSAQSDGGDDAAVDGGKHLAEAGTHHSMPEAGTKRDAAGPEAGRLDVFDAWREVQKALDASPDNLPARADALVLAKDPQKIFEFVRDEIVTYPPAPDGLDGATDAIRWGTRGTLRGGAGTPREKADLLVELYTRAGFDAQVVGGTADPAKLDGKKLLFRSLERKYAPAITAADATRWRTVLGTDPPKPLTGIDQDGSQAAAVAKSLLDLLPTTLTAPFDFTLGTIPLVSVKVNGVPKYANPLSPDAAFGDSLTKATPTPLGAASDPPAIYVKLEAVRANAPYDKFTLVEHQFDARDVVGRKIHVGFSPPVDTAALAGLPIKNVEAVVPSISVAGPDLTTDDKDKLAAVGKPVSLGGDVYDLDGSGNVTVNGTPLPEPSSDPKAASKVATVGASANGSSYPRVSLHVKAEDGSGGQVSKLPAGAITVEDGGKPVSFTITQNEAPPPKVALLFDVSSSLPAEFRGAGDVTVGNQIVTALYAKYPKASVRVGTVDFGVIWAADSFASTLVDAKAQVQTLTTASGSSELWQALHDADSEGPTLIVLVTDGAATDTLEPQYRDAIATGAPVLTLGAGTVVQQTLDQIATLSGGKSLPVTAQADAVNAVLGEIDARAVQDYVISYTAPAGSGAATSDGGSEHTVTVSINGKDATATYDEPAVPAVPPALAGLYLTVRVGTRAATRAVAGFENGFTTGAQSVAPEVLEDVRSLLFGRISIAVEGASPTASVVLGDWIADKLTLESVFDAATAGDKKGTLDALKAGFSVTPSKLPWAQPPLRDSLTKDSLTFETMPRIATLIQKTHSGGPVTRQLDLFPLQQFATATADARTAFETTLTATAGLAVAEAGMFGGSSTIKALKGATLTTNAAGALRDQTGLTPEQSLKWAALEEPFDTSYQLVAPLKPGAFWAVDEKTGTVTGILPDGSGGGVEDACNTYDQANNLLQLASLLGSLEGVSVGGWVAIAQWEVKYLTIATIVIEGGTPTGDTDLSNPAVDMGCGMLDDALGDLVPGLGTYEQVVSTADSQGLDTGLPTVCGGGMGPCG